MKDLSKRVISGIIGILLLFFIVHKGGVYLSTSIFITSLIGLREFYRALNNMDIKPLKYIGYIASFGIYITNLYDEISLNFIIVMVVIILLIVFMIGKRSTVLDVSLTLLGILYIPFLLTHIYYLDQSKYIWLVFIIAFGADTFAYIFGNLFGRRKLAPNISPNKTIEGSLGGVLGSLVLTISYSIIVGLEPLWKLVILAILISIVSQLGDLVASKIKRIAKIKDYGFIMPGHGGVLDRFDSIIFTSPMIYYFVEFFLT